MKHINNKITSFDLCQSPLKLDLVIIAKRMTGFENWFTSSTKSFHLPLLPLEWSSSFVLDNLSQAKPTGSTEPESYISPSGLAPSQNKDSSMTVSPTIRCGFP